MAIKGKQGDRWVALREEYVESIIIGQKVPLTKLAAKYGFSPQSVYNRAAKDKLGELAERRAKEREEILEQRLTERTALALDKLNEDFSTNEAEIRKRHAAIARGLQIKAVNRIKELDLSAFSARDAITMLKLGMEEERKAFGMPEVYVGDTPESAQHPEYRSVAEQIGSHQKVQEIGIALLKAFKDRVGEIGDLEDGDND